MKVIATSDLHGILPMIEEEFDLLLIAGDVCPVWCHERQYQWAWLNEDFLNWAKNLPFKDEWSKVVMCPGNHDLILDEVSTTKIKSWTDKSDRLIYLNNEQYDFEYLTDNGIEKLKIFGTPYCKVFGNWAFMRENLEKYYDFIPEGLDILISHDAADIDGLGMIKSGMYAGTNAGNTVLADYVEKTKPKYYFCGHIHSGRHEMKEIDGVKSVNVSYVSERYQPENKPFIFEI